VTEWRLARLKDVGTWYGGGTPSKSRADFWVDGVVPWLSPKDMGPDVLQSTKDHITAAAVAGSAVKLVPPGSVALVVRSGILERTVPVALVPFETTLNQDVKAIVVHDGLDPRWVAWWLRSAERQILSRARKAGTTVASLETARLHEMTLPVPPLDEQRRILDVLEDHLSRLDVADEAVERIRATNDRYLSIVLAAGLRGRLRSEAAHTLAFVPPPAGLIEPELAGASTWPVPSDWSWTTLGARFPVAVGTTPSRSDPALWSGDLPWVSSGEVAFNRIKSTRETITRPAKGGEGRIHPAGTVMLAMIGEGKTRGQAAILDIEAAHNQNCASLRTVGSGVTPEFLYYFLRERYALTRRAGSGGNQPALNKAKIESIPIPIPPQGVQQDLVRLFDDAASATSRLADELRRAKTRSSNLRQALLAAALSGHLTSRSFDLDLAEKVASA